MHTQSWTSCFHFAVAANSLARFVAGRGTRVSLPAAQPRTTLGAVRSDDTARSIPNQACLRSQPSPSGDFPPSTASCLLTLFPRCSRHFLFVASVRARLAPIVCYRVCQSADRSFAPCLLIAPLQVFTGAALDALSMAASGELERFNVHLISYVVTHSSMDAAANPIRSLAAALRRPDTS